MSSNKCTFITIQSTTLQATLTDKKRVISDGYSRIRSRQRIVVLRHRDRPPRNRPPRDRPPRDRPPRDRSPRDRPPRDHPPSRLRAGSTLLGLGKSIARSLVGEDLATSNINLDTISSDPL